MSTGFGPSGLRRERITTVRQWKRLASAPVAGYDGYEGATMMVITINRRWSSFVLMRDGQRQESDLMHAVQRGVADGSVRCATLFNEASTGSGSDSVCDAFQRGVHGSDSGSTS
ncbi:hypothetical protein BU17DRAFT_82509 [Hysterangium stoloniferum]|nr:hypothetical protein BU17DRAFT_82509 [Hysterangium stoloniferum]